MPEISVQFYLCHSETGDVFVPEQMPGLVFRLLARAKENFMNFSADASVCKVSS